LTNRVVVESGLRSCEVVDGELRLVLNNRMSAVEDGRLPLLRYFEPQGLSARVVNRLEVIFEEMISNIVRHGFEAHSDQSIVVMAKYAPGAIELSFEDDGAPFDPLEIAEPEPFSSLETARLGGLGVPLVRRLVSSVRYERPASDAPARDVGGRAFRPCNRVTLSIAA
jgi:anti-sigma regulatory factor (Ser/Thr protein kinase)